MANPSGLALAIIALAITARAPAQATTAAARGRAWTAHVERTRTSRFAALPVRAVGPRCSGGRIESLAAVAGTATIYAGAGSGNLWKSVNNGTTWRPIFEHESTFAIGAVAVAAAQPDVVWVGSGEKLMARSSYAGTGVFKSTDGGTTWRNTGLRDSHHIGKVLIDPNDADVVYVAAIGHQYTANEERGLFKTTDGGDTWTPSLRLSPRVGVVDVVMRPGDPGTLLAVAWERDRKAWNNVEHGEGSGVYKTTDAGATWTRLGGGLPAGARVGRIGLAFAPGAADVVYAVVDNHAVRGDGRVGGEVYRSADCGSTWTRVNEAPLPTAIGYDFCQLRVSPDDADELYVLGNYLLRSTDGGHTYARLGGTIVHLLRHDASVLHLDQHDLWIDPTNPDRLLLGNDGGLFQSWDRGATWLHLNNLPITEVYAVSIEAAPPHRIFIGTQDNAALAGTADTPITDGAPATWTQLYLDPWGGGDSYFTYADPGDPDTIYYEHQFGDLRRKDLRDGRTERIAPAAAAGQPPLRRNWMTPFLVSQHAPQTLFYGAERLFRSDDRGGHWTCISPDLTGQPGPERRGDVPFGTLTSIAESPLAASELWVGSDDGVVQRTTDGGRSWQAVTDLPRQWVSRVLASAHAASRAYVAMTGYRDDDFRALLFATDDGGDHWRSISGDLPDESINVVREDPVDGDVLYLGTDLGLWASIDRGDHWHALSGGLPTTPVHDLAVHPARAELVIATHGRSVFVLDVTAIRAAAAEAR